MLTAPTEPIHVLDIFSETRVTNGYNLELANKLERKLLFGPQSLRSGRHSVQHLDPAPDIWTEKPTQVPACLRESYQPLATRKMGIRIPSTVLAHFEFAVGIVREDFEEEFIWEYREPSGILTS